MGNETTHRRNLFEVDNARNLSKQELVETFIPTQAFWRLLSAKHHVVLGARGQGKTALAKMLSHDHLAWMAQKRDEPRAQSAIRDQEFIGIYLPTRLEWVGGLKNKPWLNEREREELFQWRLNIAGCIAFTPIAESCISTYVDGRAEQAQAERELAHQLSKDWIVEPNLRFDDLLQLRQHLEDTDYRKQIQILRERASGQLPAGEMPEGLAFGTDLFTPLRQGIRQLSRLLSINADCTWLLCIDEAEFLEEMDHRIINSHMRAFPDKLFFKLTTMPYCHYTLATNIGVDLVNGHDFEYVNMDSDRVMNARVSGETDTIGTRFGRTLFRKLLEASDSQIALGSGRDAPSATDVLGETKILDSRQEEWDAQSENIQLLEKYASSKTIERAHRLLGTPKFRDEISRKIHGALLLRKEISELTGNKALTVYSGARMAIRCADCNPRRLIRIFNALLMLRSADQKSFMRMRLKTSWISPEDQSRAMRTLSTSTLNQVRSFKDVGPELHEFLCMLGEYMRANLYDKPLTTDQISSVTIDNTVSDADWKLIRVAVGYGLLHPNIGSGNPDEMPWREGTFHMAYALAPHFLLLPRRGKAAKLTTIKKYHMMSQKNKEAFISPEWKQRSLFDAGDNL
ncbi:MAG: hypothetical protein D4R88_04245 [Methanosarcinales archaeon]|nr:MAG: hypothetical protein D4R88_04245 [Methanosarcinales archaeon]